MTDMASSSPEAAADIRSPPPPPLPSWWRRNSTTFISSWFSKLKWSHLPSLYPYRTMHRNRRFAGEPILPTKNLSSGETLGTASVCSETKMRTRWKAGKLVTKWANMGGTPLVVLE
ncbi:Os06g0671075 [Oryza sativa Japonica Group]|uniref:Os06g0671075 protein n=1 Tax=Oryza sativa subsp. japonica TaxID=39947 RepID=A0A0P0WZS4_ORYSJ|nr:hypothetical protein EE612_035966 [Oryza sativa]BAS99077.1 Os06g0671075 [Oryza sativa Japonica Group]